MQSTRATGSHVVREGRGAALVVVAAAWTLYGVVFFPVATFGGTGSSALLVFIPVGLTAWFYGLRRGLMAGVVAYLTNLTLHVSYGGNVADIVDFGYLVGHSVLMVFGGALGYVRDVSARYRSELRERRRIEHVLAASEEQFRVAFEDAPTGIVVLGVDGEIRRSNRAFAAIVGSADPVRAPMRAFVGESEKWDDLVRSLVSGETDVRDVEFSIVSTSGDPRWVSVVARVIDGSKGVIGVLCHVQDVTERVESSRRLEELVRSKDEFVASVSHELRTPLTAVLGFAQELQISSESDLSSEFTGAIVEQAHELAAIVEDLLVAARADIGTIALRPEEMMARDVVDPLVADLARSRSSRVAVEGDARVVADRTRLRQILRNLLSNAERYGGPHIRVVVERDGGDTVIAVVDDGEGISTEAVETIFEPYGTADHGSSRNPASVGLGLSVSRMLADLMQGVLEYRREGEETHFRLVLPSSAPPESVAIA